ncbi:MAG: alpha/beta fold hydrolase [Rhodocyclaceae bacterium]|nr:MAG: alpha/beta fold hydrolase [Rhodocyclaceae bacterium]
MSIESKSQLVQADGLRLHVTEFGQGRPLVWLHGAGAGANGVDNFIRNFPEFPDFHNLVFDAPRYGKSDKPAVNAPLFTFNAHQLAAALDTLGITRANFVGNSLGGATAIKLAATRPDLVDRLILMAPAGLTAPGEPPTDAIKIMVSALQDGPTREKVAAFLNAIVFDPKLHITEAIIEKRYQASLDPEIQATREGTKIVPSHLHDELKSIKAKSLIIWGREDAVLPVECGYRAIAGLEYAELRVISQCGHWVQHEHAAWFNRAIREFLTT